MDIRLRQGTGIDVVKAITASAPNTKTLVLSAYDDAAYVTSLARLRTSGYLLKSASAQELLRAVRVVAEDGMLYAPGISEKVKDLLTYPQTRAGGDLSNSLTNRETEVIRHVSDGLTNREIARTMGISVRTVETYVKLLLWKLGARNRTHAAIIARQIGLLSESPS
jgi:DNA-binding NarL/FixJ family response regulator